MASVSLSGLRSKKRRRERMLKKEINEIESNERKGMKIKRMGAKKNHKKTGLD